MTVIALRGTSAAIESVRRRLGDSPLPFALVADPSTADLVVTDAPAPEPNHLGVASTEAPNTFFVQDASVDYVVAALTEAHLIDAHGVAVRRPVQSGISVYQQKPRRRRFRRTRPARFDPIDYDWTTDESVETEVFDDDVVVTVGAEEFTARLRARGHLDGSDGHFHWAGTLYGEQAHRLKSAGKSRAGVALPGGDPVAAKMTEITQWGTVRMTGVGVPPWSAVPSTA
ncbi:MAG: DUF4873 domain-containing protein [Gordonia sp. (in: high G+C Gram-positive bacteria)]|uniref:DUF4873 domain-containing protein n=1 Tax=Gordonia sp. (in: high G+C Gram-positive bacteria) TaxID=84139 RepID=UPI0039E6EFE6